MSERMTPAAYLIRDAWMLAIGGFALASCNGSGPWNGGNVEQGLPPPVFEWRAAAEMGNTGTRAGQLASALQSQLSNFQAGIEKKQSELQSIFNSTAQNVEIFHGTMAAIEARLHLGTLPNNPVLIEQWNEAQAALDQIAWNARDLGRLIESLVDDAAAINDMRRQIQKLGSDPESGARDRDNLLKLDRSAGAAINLIDRLRRDSLESISRETSFVQARQVELAALQNAIRAGDLIESAVTSAGAPPDANSTRSTSATDLEQPAASKPPPVTAKPPPQPRKRPGEREPANVSQQTAALVSKPVNSLPLVIIRFDKPGVVYEGTLQRAIQKRLAEDPNTQFDLIAVFPPQDNETDLMQAEAASWQYAQAVFRSLTEEIRVAPEQIEMRTQIRDTAKSSEVHIYVSTEAL